MGKKNKHKKPKQPSSMSQCRDCKRKGYVHRYEYFRSSRPRCVACGGSMDYLPFVAKEVKAAKASPVVKIVKPEPVVKVSEPGTLVLNFDGSCNPNPGGIPAYGWSLSDSEGNVIEQKTGQAVCSLAAECRTNNVAEWLALIEGVKYLVARGKPIDRLDIRGDSKLVISVARGEWKSSKPHLSQLRDQYRALVRLLDVGHIDLAWVPREQNQVADSLSKA